MKTIVIVEDEYRTRVGIKNLIEKLSDKFTIIGEACDGREGIIMIKDRHPDIVFTDIKMPKITGLKMIEDVQFSGLKPHFILLTGYADFEYARTALRLGVEDYLLKPISVDKMKNLLIKLSAINDSSIEKYQDKKYSQLFKDILNYIDKNFGQHITLTDLSDKYGVCCEYISTLFVKEIGENFSLYLKKIRIEKAKEMLLKDNSKIYEVAMKVGYNDSKYFSKVFKEYTGMSAKDYIRSNLKDTV